jgi:predicted RNA-binding Zn-ribbon protein involved in translation (DUF1610 family)
MQVKATCPKCGREMKRAAYLPAANDLPAVESFRCEACGEKITMETGTGGFSGWDTYPNGDIAVSPVTGWSTALFMPGMTGGLRFEYAVDEMLEGRSSVQFVLTTPQVHELITSLQQLAGILDATIAADKPVGPLS